MGKPKMTKSQAKTDYDILLVALAAFHRATFDLSRRVYSSPFLTKKVGKSKMVARVHDDARAVLDCLWEFARKS